MEKEREERLGKLAQDRAALEARLKSDNDAAIVSDVIVDERMGSGSVCNSSVHVILYSSIGAARFYRCV